uniref:Putative secreted protein n=1 Tax=Rhipicephalus microplus TaxID=6941 RepID=A0A6M2D9C6_RHIMP
MFCFFFFFFSFPCRLAVYFGEVNTHGGLCEEQRHRLKEKWQDIHGVNDGECSEAGPARCCSFASASRCRRMLGSFTCCRAASRHASASRVGTSGFSLRARVAAALSARSSAALSIL